MYAVEAAVSRHQPDPCWRLLLLSAISLIYWFGNQGIAKNFMQALGISQIYGAPGIVLAECFAVFPHALMILITALSWLTPASMKLRPRWARAARASFSPSHRRALNMACSPPRW